MQAPRKGVKGVTIKEQLADALSMLRADLRKSAFKDLLRTAFRFEGRLAEDVIMTALLRKKKRRLDQELSVFSKAKDRDYKDAFPAIFHKYEKLEKALQKVRKGQKTMQMEIDQTDFRRFNNRKRALKLQVARHLDGQIEEQRLRHRKTMRGVTDPALRRNLTSIHKVFVDIAKDVHKSIPISHVIRKNEDWTRYLQ